MIKFGAPHGAPGQALHHPAMKEHEFIGWILAMHFLAALELVAASLTDPGIGLDCDDDRSQQKLDVSLLPKPYANLNVSDLPPWTSILFGEEMDNRTHRWRMRPTHCRTTFEPIMGRGDLVENAISGAVAQDMDIMLPKSKMYYNRGWVMDLSEKEKAAKRTLGLYGGLGFVDSKKAFYGIVMSGKLRLFLPYESSSSKTSETYPRVGDKAIGWFHSVVICKVNEKRDADKCEMGRDLGFEVGGVDVVNSTQEIAAAGTLYLGRKMCVHIAVPPNAILTNAAKIAEQDNESSVRRRNIVFPHDAEKKPDTRVGLEVTVRVRNHLFVQVSQACSVSHVVWEQQII